MTHLRHPWPALTAGLWAASIAANAAEPTASPSDGSLPRQPPAVVEPASPWDFVRPSTRWYLHYETGRVEGEPRHRVHVSRGYATLRLEPVEWFRPRITLDTHQDDTGDWKVRLKYLHARFVLPIETAVLTEPDLEVGIAHNPWFDYEEHINRYRAEGKMPIERIGVLNSADLGATVGGLIGERLPEDYQERVSSSYPGTWGSFAFGLYNGGGYHAAEENDDKVFMSRLSLRPLGPVLPNLQLSHFFVHGKGNTGAEPDFRLHDFMMSLETAYLVIAGQVGFGAGNQAGDRLDDSGEALGWAGWSVFGEVELPWIRSSLIGRFDAYDWGTTHGFEPTHRIIAGHAFHFLPNNFLLASVDVVDGGERPGPADRQARLTLQIAYP